MPKKYQKKIRKWTEADMEKALDDVNKGLRSIRATGRLYGMAETVSHFSPLYTITNINFRFVSAFKKIASPAMFKCNLVPRATFRLIKIFI